MKNLNSAQVLFIILSLTFAACSQKTDLDAERNKAKIVVDQFQQFWESEDMTLLDKIMSHDQDMVNFGSDATEVFKGWEQLKSSVEAMLPAFDSIRINVKNQVINVHPSGQVAWFSEQWDWNMLYNGKALTVENQRLTGVLEKRNGVWKIVQFHNSVPVSG